MILGIPPVFFTCAIRIVHLWTVQISSAPISSVANSRAMTVVVFMSPAQSLVDALEALRVLIGLKIKIDDGCRCAKTQRGSRRGLNTASMSWARPRISRWPASTPAQLYNYAKDDRSFLRDWVCRCTITFTSTSVQKPSARWMYDGLTGKQIAWNPGALDMIAV